MRILSRQCGLLPFVITGLSVNLPLGLAVLAAESVSGSGSGATGSAFYRGVHAWQLGKVGALACKLLRDGLLEIYLKPDGNRALVPPRCARLVASGRAQHCKTEHLLFFCACGILCLFFHADSRDQERVD